MSVLESTVGVRGLSDVVLSAQGEDARSWLQGQITNDVARSEPGMATYTLVTTVKGRVLGDAWVLDRGQAGFWLVVPEAAAAGVHDQLERQIIMEDVELTRPEACVLTAQGPAAGELRAAVSLPAFAVDRLGLGGVDFVCEGEDACGARLDAIATAAAAVGGARVSEDEWEAVRVARAVPSYGRDFDAGTYPQEAGLGRAVSFTKGCYVGQEVVCRLEQRGKVTRRLVCLEVPTEPAGAIEAGGEPVGEITSAAPKAGGWIALGYVKRRALADRHALTVGGAPATVRAVVGPTDLT
jgi:folate-binding protein YgfZ